MYKKMSPFQFITDFYIKQNKKFIQYKNVLNFKPPTTQVSQTGPININAITELYSYMFSNFCFCCVSYFFCFLLPLLSNPQNLCFRPCKTKHFHYDYMQFIQLAGLTFALNALNYSSQNSNSCFLCYSIKIVCSLLICHI